MGRACVCVCKSIVFVLAMAVDQCVGRRLGLLAGAILLDIHHLSCGNPFGFHTLRVPCTGDPPCMNDAILKNVF